MAILISELTEDVRYLTEEREGKKQLYIEGVFLQSNLKNRNGRIYPRPILEREVDRYRRELIENNRAMGELSHPTTPGINLDRVSHIVKECRQNGDDFVGKALILDTPMGKIAQSLIQAEARLGVSSRGLGTLKEDKKLGAKVVQEDFKLAVMIDIVADPSAPSAWVNGVMENVEWVINEQGEWQSRAIEEIRETVRKTPSSLLEETKVRLFADYIDRLTEAQIVQSLSRDNDVPESSAEAAVRRAKLKARLNGQPQDPGLIWRSAKQILGVAGR